MKRVWTAIAAVAICTAATTMASAQNADVLARGSYIVNSLAACANCHTPRNPDGSMKVGLEFAGGFEFVDPNLGTTYSRNITQDKDTGIGSWTDDQILKAMREGVNKEGEILMPPMPFNTFNHMSNDDARAVVAYLRTIKPVHNEVPQDKLKIPRGGNAMAAVGAPAPPRGPTVAYGAYLLTSVIDCFECHTTPDATGQPDFAHHLGAGGLNIAAFGLQQLSANITPGKGGIGNWSDDDIKKAITQGISKDKAWPIFPAMPYDFFKTATPDDISAIVAFLRTIPPVDNVVDRKDWRPPGPPPPAPK